LGRERHRPQVDHRHAIDERNERREPRSLDRQQPSESGTRPPAHTRATLCCCSARRAAIGSVGDAYDNSLAESFVDTFKTELIADRVWRTRSQLELAIVEWVAWFNTERLRQSLGDIPPAEFEALYARQDETTLPLR
jgi:transposase InsO family protein